MAKRRWIKASTEPADKPKAPKVSRLHSDSSKPGERSAFTATLMKMGGSRLYGKKDRADG
jgi:hypothetical protein